jgi:hypothetical protein
MEELTKFEPYGESLMIKRVITVSNLALNGVGKVKPEHEKEISITIVKVGNDKYKDVIGKRPMFPSNMKQMMINGSATLVYDMDNKKSIQYYQEHNKESNVIKDNKEIDITGVTEFVDYFIVNANYLIGIK